jgi:hypothetical protein
MPASSSPSIFDWIAGALLAAGLMALVSGCAGTKAVPVPTVKHVQYASSNGYATTLPALNQGRKLYITRCSSCHNLKAPASLSAAEWPDMVERMATNAELNDVQKRAITQYLVAIAAAAQDTSSAAPAATGSPASP